MAWMAWLVLWALGGLWGDHGDWEAGRKGVVWRPAPRAPQIYFWEWVKALWQATAIPPIRLRNSWESSIPSQLMSSSCFFFMRSRTLGSFWFFVKAACSVLMKLRKSVLERLHVLPSFPAYFWKTAIRDSMYSSVSVGLDVFGARRGDCLLLDFFKGFVFRS